MMKYHQGYDDPTADMIIEVQGATRFRVHSYVLEANSVFFRDMPEYPEELCGDTDRTIQLDASPEIFAVILDFLNRQETESGYSWTVLQPALHVAARYQFDTFPSLLAVHLDRRFSKGWAWQTFLFASRYEFPGLAKQAVASLGESIHPLIKYADMKPTMFSGAKAEYAVAFLQAVAKHSPNATVAAPDFKIDWKAVSGSFGPRGE